MSKKINDAIIDALVDANERLRKENAVLKAALRERGIEPAPYRGGKKRKYTRKISPKK